LPGKHGANPKFENYLEVHNKWMTALIDDGFVVDDRSAFTFLPSAILLEGPIHCLDSTTLDVAKEIGILSGSGMSAKVRTRTFRYHAWVRGVHNILRYESAHEHRPHAHKHQYATFGNGLETAVVDLLDERQVPTLGEVLRELQTWHAEHAAQIRSLR
jgi:hypothetical protein